MLCNCGYFWHCPKKKEKTKTKKKTKKKKNKQRLKTNDDDDDVTNVAYCFVFPCKVRPFVS